MHSQTGSSLYLSYSSKTLTHFEVCYDNTSRLVLKSVLVRVTAVLCWFLLLPFPILPHSPIPSDHFFFFFGDSVSYSTGGPSPDRVAKTGLEPGSYLFSPMLGLQVCVTVPNLSRLLRTVHIGSGLDLFKCSAKTVKPSEL